MSSTLINGVRYELGSWTYYKALQREKQRKEEEKRNEKRKVSDELKQHEIEEAWKHAQSSLQVELRQVHNASEYTQLSSSIQGLEASFKQAINDGKMSNAKKMIEDMRQRIMFVQADERMLASQQDKLLKFLSKIETEASKSFASEFEAIRKSISTSGHTTIKEQTELVKNLMNKAQKLASEAVQANVISLDELTEQAVFIPPVVNESAESQETLNTQLLYDICDFFERITFFDELEANRIEPLVLEAKQGTNPARLKLILSQIKVIYGQLREQAIMTNMFKKDLREFLPLMRKAHDTERLCMRIEDLLNATVISRETYNEVYKSFMKVFSEQMERIENAMLAEKIVQVLGGMGYILLDEQGNPTSLVPGEMRMLSTPFEGYRVRIKINKNNNVTTRLVRLVGSEEEKTSVSEYQRQRDVEAGKKWCNDLDKFYKALKDNGLAINTIMRKEPGEEQLDIIIDKSVQKQQRTTVIQQQQEQIQERSVSLS